MYRTVKTTYRMTEFRSVSGELTDAMDEVKQFLNSQRVIEESPIESWILNSYGEDGHILMLFWSPSI